jgi:F-type H+-transporting ATPase subunit b
MAEPTHTGTQQPGTPGHEHEPTAFGLDAAQWVSLAMVVVFAILIWKRVPAAIGSALDKKIASIRGQLEEAAQLRSEAEELKAEYQAKAAAAEAEAATMIERARHEAEGIVEQARTDTAALIERRGRIAQDKIAAAERQAIDQVRAKVANAAAAAAARLIEEDLGSGADKNMVDSTIAGLSSR